MLRERKDGIYLKALGFDIGTTTISAVVMDMDSGKIQEAYTISNDSFLPTEHEWEKLQDAGRILEKAHRLLDDILEAYTDVGVIGLTGQMHGIVYVDEDARDVSPLYTWQDGRGAQACFDGGSLCELIEKRHSLRVYTGYGLVTHLYLVRTGQVPKKAVKICTIMDYLGMSLTGRNEPVLHSSTAASLGFYDVEKGGFMRDILEEEEIDTAILPQVTEQFQIIGTYKGIPVSVAIGDNQASFLGAVRDADETLLVNMGTGGQISVLADRCFAAEGIEARPFAPGRFLLVGASLCGGRAYALLESFFRSYAECIGAEGMNHYEMMERLMERGEPSECLRVSTCFSGTRSEPEKKGSIENIGVSNFTPEALVFGVLEGMADELYGMYRRIDRGIGEPKSIIVASGNGIRRNCRLQEIMGKKFGMLVKLAKNEEEAASGAAFAGMIATGILTLEEAVGITGAGEK